MSQNKDKLDENVYHASFHLIFIRKLKNLAPLKCYTLMSIYEP